jgi:hypothetical protein
VKYVKKLYTPARQLLETNKARAFASWYVECKVSLRAFAADCCLPFLLSKNALAATIAICSAVFRKPISQLANRLFGNQTRLRRDSQSYAVFQRFDRQNPVSF